MTMKKSVFTFTVKGQKFTFNTIKELQEAKAKLIAEGKNVDLHSIKREDVVVKASASLQFGAYTFEEGQRVMDVTMTVKSADAESVFDALATRLENELSYHDVQFMRCPDEMEGQYVDSFVVEYSHGSMADIKKEIMGAFKSIKKELCIR